MEEPDRQDRSRVGLDGYRDHTAGCHSTGSNAAAADRLADGLVRLDDREDVEHGYWTVSEDIAAHLKKKLHLGHRDVPAPNGCTADRINGVVHWRNDQVDGESSVSREASSPSGDESRLAPDDGAPNDMWTQDGVEDTSIEYVAYESEQQMPDIMRLFQKDLSEPYSIYTYRYFIHNWPRLCFLVRA